MAGTIRFRTWAKVVPLLALVASLSACGSRDSEIAEQVMEAKQAAQRAEAARAGAEQALARMTKQQPVADAAVIEEDSSEDIPGDEVKPDVDTETGFTDGNPNPQG